MERIECVKCGYDLVHHTDGRAYEVTCPECGEGDAAREPEPAPGVWGPLALSVAATFGSFWTMISETGIRGMARDPFLLFVGLGGLGWAMAVVAVKRAYVGRKSRRDWIGLEAIASIVWVCIASVWKLFVVAVVVNLR